MLIDFLLSLQIICICCPLLIVATWRNFYSVFMRGTFQVCCSTNIERLKSAQLELADHLKKLLIKRMCKNFLNSLTILFFHKNLVTFVRNFCTACCNIDTLVRRMDFSGQIVSFMQHTTDEKCFSFFSVASNDCVLMHGTFRRLDPRVVVIEQYFKLGHSDFHAVVGHDARLYFGNKFSGY